MTRELLNLLESKVYKSNTIGVYENLYKRLLSKTNKPLTECEPEKVIEVLNEQYPNINSRWTALNLVVMILSCHNHDIKPYLEYRNILTDIKDEYVTKCLEDKHHTLPTYESFIEKLNMVTDPTKYVINFLLINYGLRNLDLDIYITQNKEDLVDRKEEHKQNIALVGTDSTSLFIDNYKTFSTYGRKVIHITNEKFQHNIKQLIGHYLLRKQNGEHMTSSIATIIKRNTIFNLPESSVFKIIMMWVKRQPSVRTLMKEYSKTRGTNMGTMIQYYTPECRIKN